MAHDQAQTLTESAPPPRCLIVPGLDNSGPDHWQSLWEVVRGDCRRVELGRWSNPDRALWTARLDRAVRNSAEPVVLVAHSLGCLAVAWWAQNIAPALAAKVRGALLVAPPDVDRPGGHPVLAGFAPSPPGPLPFASILVASRNDPYADPDALAALAARWGSRLVDAGPCGHINTESDLGLWPAGEALLEELIAAGRGDRPALL